MSQASCATVTLVNTAMVVAGSVSGTILVGMTVTGAGVPPGVTVASYGTGSGGAGTYTCTSSAANVTIAEPMTFNDYMTQTLLGNTLSPQLADMRLAAGFAFIVASAITGPSAGPGQEYQFGTHQVAVHNAQAISGTNIFPVSKGIQGRSVVPTILTQPQFPEPRSTPTFPAATVTTEVALRVFQLIYAAPQQYDFTLQGSFSQPQLAQSGSPATEYHFGTHQKAIYDSQGGTAVWKSVNRLTALDYASPRQFVVPPQNVDLTIQGFVKTIPLAQGWLFTMITAGPQFADLTLQAQFTAARPFQSAFSGPLRPAMVVGYPQADPNPVPPLVYRPPTSPSPIYPLRTMVAQSPDPTQLAARIFPAVIAGGQHYVQPTWVHAFPETYTSTWQPPASFSQPLRGIYIPPVLYPVQTFMQVGEQAYQNPPFVSTSPPIVFGAAPVPPTPPTGPSKHGGYVVLDGKKLGETLFEQIDFISQLAPNETIVSATCSCTVYTGNDPFPQNMIVGAANIQGTVVSQLVTGGVLGTIYEILAAASTSLGQTIELSAYLAVIPDLQ